MIRQQSTKSNLIFQVCYQVLIWVVPLIVAPYLTRHLGSNSLGIYTYVNSIAYYFLILANLGIAKYGQRAIAEIKDNELELRKCFWSLYCNHIISSIIAVILFLLFLFLFVSKNQIVYIISTIYVFSAFFDVSWLFYGLENFKGVAVKNAIIKVFELVCIFLFVKEPTDLNQYTLIMCLSALLGQLVLVPQAMKTIKPIAIQWKDILGHTKPLLFLFISVMAITLYTVFDKTLLGLLATNESVAYYEYSNRIINIPKQLISIISTILFPKVCYLINSGRFEDSRRYLKLSVIATSFLAFASIFGIVAIADEFAVLYYGEEFIETGKIMICMSPLIYILTLGDTIRLQYMIPNHKDRAYIICACCNATVNLIVSATLIPLLGVYGAVLGTLCAEFFGLVFQMIYSRRVISLRLIFGQGLPFVIIGIMMFACIKIVSLFLPISIIGMIFEIIIGGFVYCTLAMIYLLMINHDKLEYRSIIKHLWRK